MHYVNNMNIITIRFGPTGSGPWEDHNRFGPLSGPNAPFKGYPRDFDERYCHYNLYSIQFVKNSL